MSDASDISEIVVNATMNRGRGLTGVNSYERELRRFDIAAFLRKRAEAEPSRTIRWLDACCGQGRALQEAAQLWTGKPWAERIEIVGVDLYDDLPANSGPTLRFLASDLEEAIPDGPWDLVTCVHGLHYLPDKLGFLERIYPQLSLNSGLLLAHLDTGTVRCDSDTDSFWPKALRHARRNGATLRLTNHLLRIERTSDSFPALSFGAQYIRRTVSTYPNFSGMIGLDSWYVSE